MKCCPLKKKLEPMALSSIRGLPVLRHLMWKNPLKPGVRVVVMAGAKGMRYRPRQKVLGPASLEDREETGLS
jgi:hypothetical protein